MKQVMKEAGRGMLSGVCGPVTQLLKTPREYAVALETALGASMQHIVVETEQDAKNAIRLLKQRDWGRATFLPLTTIRGNVYDPREIQQLPGFVGMANTLCSCEEKYGSIRDSLLGRVAVAEDLDSAAAIAKRTGYHLRVVSLDGQVVNAGGSLTGGSKGRSSGLLSRASEIQRIREKQRTCSGRRRPPSRSTASGKGSSPPVRRSWMPPGASFPPPRRSASASPQSGPGSAGNWNSLRRTAAGLEKERNDSEGRLQELGEREKAVRAAISQLEGQVRQAETESQRLSGILEEQMSHCDEISPDHPGNPLGRVLCPERLGRLGRRCGGSEERKRDSAGAVLRLRQEMDALRKKHASGTAAAGRAGSGTGTERPGGDQTAKPAVHRPTALWPGAGGPKPEGAGARGDRPAGECGAGAGPLARAL